MALGTASIWRPIRVAMPEIKVVADKGVGSFKRCLPIPP